MDAAAGSGTKRDSDRIVAIDGLRAWAVLLVFAVHFNGAFAFTYRGLNFDKMANARSLELSDFVLYWLFYSHYGVQIFFVISGFVITRSVAANETLTGYLSFLAHRVVRIYPAFLISLAAAILVSLHYSWIHSVTAATVLQNLLFLNGAFALQIPAYNGVTWSLFFEFIFYIVFPLLYLIAIQTSMHPRRLAPLYWLAFVAALGLLAFREWFLFLPFLLGSWAGLQPDDSLRRLSNHLTDGYLVAAYVLTTSVACFLLPLPRVSDTGLVWPAASPVFFGCLSAIVTLIVVRASFGDGFLRRVLSARPMLALGRISFSFFLIHTTVLAVVFQYASSSTTESLGSTAVVALAGFLVSVVVATVLYEIAERPYYLFYRYARRRRR